MVNLAVPRADHCATTTVPPPTSVAGYDGRTTLSYKGDTSTVNRGSIIDCKCAAASTVGRLLYPPLPSDVTQ